MKRKDIFCVILILFLIYIVMKPNIEGLTIVVGLSRKNVNPFELEGVIPDVHSHTR